MFNQLISPSLIFFNCLNILHKIIHIQVKILISGYLRYYQLKNYWLKNKEIPAL